VPHDELRALLTDGGVSIRGRRPIMKWFFALAGVALFVAAMLHALL
jgi:hypothetical protein